MLHRVDLFFVGAEHAPRIRESSSQLLERRLHLLEACLIPMRNFKRAGPFLVEPDLILQSIDLPDVFLVRKIDKETDYVCTLSESFACPKSPAPLIPHEIDYDFVERKGNKHGSEQAQRGGDDRGLETGRRRASRRGCGAGSGRVKAHDLRVEGEVRGDGCEPGAGSEAVA